AAASRLKPREGQRMRAGTLSVRALAAQTGIDRQHFLPAARRRSRIPFDCISPAVDALDAEATARAGRVVWQEIESIEPAGEERVYDITVDRIHNFVANNVIVHNCIYQEQYLEIAKQVVGGAIRFGLNAVKNVGDPAARAIIAAREEGGPFESLWDFTERVDPQCANKRALESLIKCGALDSTGSTRRGMLECVEQALSWGGRSQADKIAGQGSIFDLGDEVETAPKHHPEIPAHEFEKNELLRLEKETLGVYVSEHPLNAVRDQLRRKTDAALAELERRRDGEIVTVGGIVSAVNQVTTKKGEPMVFVRLDDVIGSADCAVFNSVYASSHELLVPDAILVVKARIDHKEGETKLIAIEVSSFEATPERREVLLRIDALRAKAG